MFFLVAVLGAMEIFFLESRRNVLLMASKLTIFVHVLRLRLDKSGRNNFLIILEKISFNQQSLHNLGEKKNDLSSVDSKSSLRR